MHRTAFALTAIALAGCLPSPGAGPQTERQSVVFSIAGNQFTMDLPANARIDTRNGLAVDDHTRGQRLQRRIEITGTSRMSTDRRRSIRLNAHARLTYRIDDDFGGGSGGSIAELRGKLTVGGQLLHVTCTDQDELSPNAQWCLIWLRHIKPVNTGSAE